MTAHKDSFFLSPVLVILFLASCSSLEREPAGTLIPTQDLPTVIAQTVEAQRLQHTADSKKTEMAETEVLPTSTQQPTAQNTPTPTPTQITPTPSPSRTPTPTQANLDPPPTNVPPANLQFIRPGQGSAVTSPFQLRAAIKPGSKAVVRIELLGEDGRLLMREVQNYQSLELDWININSDVTFGTNSAAEAGRLLISVDDEFGRLKDLSSVDLILLNSGEQILNQPADQLQNIVIESPYAKTLIQGGVLRVKGLARPRSTKPLMIEIQTSDGRIVGTRQVAVTSQPGIMYGTFEIDVPYNLENTSQVRLKVWEPGDSIPGIVNLSSLEVILSP